MKRLLVLAVVLVLLALMVSSVSAHVIQQPSPAVPPDVNGIGVANVVPNPPTFPDSAASVSPEEGKASPILFRHAPVTIEDGDIAGGGGTTKPNRAGVVPDDQYSLNRLADIIINKRAVTPFYDPIEEIPPCYPRCRNLN